jgi:5'-nucleotidase/UDP-sugar diphosphatase
MAITTLRTRPPLRTPPLTRPQTQRTNRPQLHVMTNRIRSTNTESGIARSSGGFPQVSGLELTYCADRASDMHAELNEITPCPDALLEDGVITSLVVAGIAVDLNASYRIATNTFLVGGGDYYSSFEQACTRSGNYCLDTGILMLDALVDEFQTNTTVVRELEGRIVAE